MKSRRSSRLASVSRRRASATALGSVALAAGALLSPRALAATQQLLVSGDWDTTSPIWGGTTWVNGNDATFGGSASTIEIAGNIQVAGINSANNLTFNDAIPGGSVTLVASGQGNAAISGGRDLTFNVGLGGSVPLLVNNAGGVVTFNADNVVTGSLSILGGSVVVGQNGAFNAVASIGVSAGASLTTSAVNQLGQVALTNAGTLTLGGNDTVASVTNTGTINGPGILRASTYSLGNGSVVNAQLGNGGITTNGTVALNAATGAIGGLSVQSGTTTVAAALGATDIAVGNGATLATTAAGTLADTAAVGLTGTAALQLGQSDTIGRLSGAGTVALGANTLTLANGAGATSAAAIGGTGGVTLLSGAQTLSGASTYTGATNVAGGTLALTGSLASTTVNVADGAALTSGGGLADATAFNLNVTGTATFTGAETLASLTGGTGAVTATGQTLTVTGALNTSGNVSVANLSAGQLLGAATINSSGAVTAGGGEFSGVISSGSLVKNTAGALTLSGAGNAPGGVTVAAGTLTLAHATNTLADTAAVAVQTGATLNILNNADTVASLAVTGGTVAGTGTLTASSYSLADGATVNANLGAGALTVTSGTATLAGSSAASEIDVRDGATLVTTATGSLADNAALTLRDTGALQLGQSDTIGRLLGTGTVALGANTLSLSSGGGATSNAVISGTGGVTLLAGAQTLGGANTYTGATNVAGGTLALTGSLSSTTVNVSAGAALASTGGLADATALTVAAGGSATFTGAETLASLAGAGAVSATALTVGTLDGAATVNSTGTVTASSGAFSGNLASGALLKTGVGTLTLSGTNTATGGTTVAAGTLALAHATNTLADTGALVIGPGATVDLGANADTVASLVNNGGTLAGTGTLTAATYALNDGSVVDARLGAGAITANGTVALNNSTGAGSLAVQSGTTTLAGALGASAVNVAGGTLAISSPGRLASGAAVSISSGAALTTSSGQQIFNTAITNAGTLTLAGNDTVASLNNTGTIAGPGTLTTAVYNLGAGSSITGNLGAGVVNVTGPTGISGTSAAGTVNVNAGTLFLTGNNLADTAVVTNAATITLTGADTVATLDNTGTIAGAGVLTAATYNLANGSQITGNLGAGAANITGAVTISGSAAADTLAIAAGANLTLTGDNLADAATLSNRGTLTLQGAETVGTYVSFGAALTGIGTLTASTYDLRDGTVLDANVGPGSVLTSGAVTINGLTGTGALTVQNGLTTLNATSGAGNVQVAAGALVLTADAEINIASTVGIAAGASLTTAGVNQIGNATLTNAGTLALGGNDNIAAYVANGGTLNGAGRTLSAATYALNNGAVVNANLGNGALTANGTVQVNGTVGAGSLTVQSGTTTLANVAGSTAVAVTGGTLALGANSALQSATTIDISSGGTLALGASDQLGNAAALTNAGTLALGAFSDTVATYTSNGGAITGTGTLTAATYTINGGTVGANLGNGDIITTGTVALTGATGTGTLTVNSGATSLAAASGATAVTVNAGALTLGAAASLNSATTLTLGADATLTTGAANQLADTAALTSAGTLVFGGNETLASITGGALSAAGRDIVLTGSLATTGAVSVDDLTVGSLDGSSTITATGTVSAAAGTFAGNLASGALTKTGPGTLTLSGANTYSGATLVSGGTLALTGSLAGRQVGVATGATLTSTGGLADDTGLGLSVGATATFTGNETLTSLSGAGTLNAAGTDLTVTDSIDSSAAITVDDLTVNRLAGTASIAATGLVTVNSGDFDGVISTGSLLKTGAGTLTLTATQGYTGGTTVSTGTLVLANATNTLADTGALVFGFDSVIDLGANTDTVASLSGNGTLRGTGTLTASTYTLTNGANILAKLGAGALTTAGSVALNNDLGVTSHAVQSGVTTLSAASAATTVSVADGAALVTTAAGSLADTAALTLAGTGAFTLGQSETIGSLAGAGAVNLGVHTLTLSNGGGASSTAAISGTGGLTLQSGAQTLAATTYTGTTTVNGGTLTLAGTSQTTALDLNGGTLLLNAASAATTVDIAAGATLTTGGAQLITDNAAVTNSGVINLGGAETFGNLSGTGVVNLSGFNLTFAGNNQGPGDEIISDFAGSINGSGTVTKSGDDIQILSGTSNYSGIASVQQGVLRVTAAGALGLTGTSARTEVTGTGTLQIAGGFTLTEVVRITGAGAAATFTGNDATLSTLGAINNLSGNNLLTGQIGVIGQVGVNDTVIGAQAGTLRLTGDIVRANNVAVPRLTFQAATGATIVATGTNNFLHFANIVDIAKTGGGLLDLSDLVGNNSSGNLLLQDGTVLVDAEIDLGGSNVIFGSTGRGTLQIESTAAQAAITAGPGQVVTGGDGGFADFRNTVFDLTSGAGTLQADADTAIRASNITNPSARTFTKTGAGNLLIDILSVTSLPSLSVQAGTVYFLAADNATVSLGGLSGTADGTVNFGALDLTLAQTATSTFAGNLTGTGDLTVNATNSAQLTLSGVLSGFASVTVGGDAGGLVTFAGNNTYTGPTNVADGGLLLVGGTLQSATINVATGGTLVLGAAERLVDTAAVNNSGVLTLGSGAETVGTYVSDGGVLAGTGTLTATSYDLNDGSVVNARLGSGPVTVEGLVRVNNQVGGDLTVLAGGELRGTGLRVGGDLIVEVGATFAPGASPGVTNVLGDWIQNGVFAAELAGTGGPGAANGHDQVVVSGTITLGPSSTLAIQRSGAFTEPARGDTFRVINGALGTQQFATVTSQFTTGLVLDLADGTLIGTGLTGTGPSRRVDLTQLAGLDANTLSVVAALQDQAFSNDPVNGVQFNSSVSFGNPAGAAIRALLTSPVGPGNGINLVSPESYAAETAYAERASRHYADLARESAPLVRIGGGSLFASYSGHSFETSGSRNDADYELTGSGGLFGGRYAFGEKGGFSLGAYAAFDAGDIESTYRKASVDGTTYGLVADIALGERLTLSASAFVGDYDSDSSRDSYFTGRRSLDGSLSAETHGFTLGLSHATVRRERSGFSPYVEFSYADSTADAVTEAGSAPDALAVAETEYTSLRGELGARGYVMVNDRFSFTGRLGVSQEFGDDETDVTARLVAGSGLIRVTSPGAGDTAVTAALGARYDLTKRLHVEAGVQAAAVTDAQAATSYHLGGGFRF